MTARLSVSRTAHGSRRNPDKAIIDQPSAQITCQTMTE